MCNDKRVKFTQKDPRPTGEAATFYRRRQLSLHPAANSFKFCSSHTHEKVFSLIGSSPLTEVALIFQMFNVRCASSCNIKPTFNLVIKFLHSVDLFSCPPYPPPPQVELSSHLILTLFLPSSSPLFILSSLHAELHLLFFPPYVNNTWPSRLWMWKRKRIPGLVWFGLAGCFGFFSPVSSPAGPSRF